MRIVAATVSAVRFPLREPFVISYARYDDMPAVVVELRTDTGLVGWGEAVPDENVTGEHYRATFQILTHLLLPRVMGRQAHDIEAIHHELDAVIDGNPAAKAAIDLACHDLLGQAAGMPVHDLVGGRSNPEHVYPRVLSIGEPDAMAATAQRALDDGYAAIKIKVGAGEPAEDVARIRAVCDAVAGRVPVRVDVNQGWRTPAVAVEAIRSLEGCGLTWVEQPIRMGDIAGLAEVRRAVAVPIMADETCHDLRSLLEIIRQRAADVINIKLMKAGGIMPALTLATVAEAAGMTAQIGSMVESSIASAAGYHVATARANIRSTELTGPLLFTREIGDLRYDLPHVHLSGRPGLGVTVDRDALDDLTQDRVDVTPRSGRGPLERP